MIVCSSEDEQRSHILSKLHAFRRQFTMQSVFKCAEYLRHHFTSATDETARMQACASAIDVEKLEAIFKICMLTIGVFCFRANVRIVTSQRSGMGKSLFIKRMAQALQCTDQHQPHLVSIPIHGPLVTADTVMELLKLHLCVQFSIFHFDIALDVRILSIILLCF